jgi:hypothetical protein
MVGVTLTAVGLVALGHLSARVMLALIAGTARARSSALAASEVMDIIENAGQSIAT